MEGTVNIPVNEYNKLRDFYEALNNEKCKLTITGLFPFGSPLIKSIYITNDDALKTALRNTQEAKDKHFQLYMENRKLEKKLKGFASMSLLQFWCWKKHVKNIQS